MALRKASSYTKFKSRPYTRRSRAKGKNYIKAVPGMKIAKFHIGNQADYNAGKHSYVVRLISEENVQLRDNAIEAARMYLTKMLDEKDLGQYYFAIRVYPHHCLRENKVATGAGADRMKCGMSQSFGIVVGRAAMVRPGQELFFISCANEKTAKDARDSLHAIRSKMPCKTRVVFEKVGNTPALMIKA